MIRLLRSLPLVALWLWAGCVSDPQCKVNGDCPAAHQCVSGACLPAEAPDAGPPVNECGDRISCEQGDDCATGVCDDGCCAVTCTGDEQCRSDEWCRGGWCRPIGSPCGSNADCDGNAATPACDLATGSCVGCVTEADCGTGQLCVDQGCVSPPATGCTRNADCTNPQLKYCFVPLGKCVSCLEDTDCPGTGTMVCDASNNACKSLVQGCGWDGDCLDAPRGRRCDQEARTCVQCLDHDDCPRDRLCQSDNTCTTWPSCASDGDCSGTTPHCKTAELRCVECTTATQCGSGKTCRNNFCVPSTNGCVEDADCSSSKPHCDTRTRTCAVCVDSEDCDDGFCEADGCRPCTDSLECLAANFTSRPYCVGGGCRECMRTDDCSDGFLCHQMKCVLDPVDGPCQSNGECFGDYRCVPDPSGRPTCREPCEPFAVSTGCSSGKACEIAYFQAGIAVGACLPKVPGAAQRGQTCSQDVACDVGLECLPSGVGQSKCRRPCDPDGTNVCAFGEKCQYTAQLDLRGVPRSVGLCFPDTTQGDPCVNDASCDAGQICGAAPNPVRPFEWGNFCKWPVGTKTGGQSCSRDGDCVSGLCLPGAPGGGSYCQGACESDADCPARADGVPGVCGQAAVAWVDHLGQPTTMNVPSCVLPCREDSECPNNQFCEVVPNGSGDGWSTRCAVSPYPNGARGGGTCRADSECRSGSCLTFGAQPTGVCSGACGGSMGDAACHFGAVCPPDGVVRRVGPGADGVLGNADDPMAAAPLCWTKPCTTNAECGPGRVCAPDPDPNNFQDIVLSCHPIQGTVAGGGACTTSDDCRTGLCRYWSSANQLCFGACETNADCASNRCQSIKWTASATKTVKVCIPP